MGFSSFCLRAAGEHAVRWSQPVGARIARPIGAFRLKGQRMCPRFTGECGLRGRLAHKRRGNQNGSPCLLRITTPSFRARCARRSKSLFCCAARPPQRVSRTGATPEQQARIARTRQRPVGWYPSFLLLMADGRQGGEKSLTFAREARPYLRQQMQKIFLLFARRSAPGEKGEGVIHKRGGTLVPPLLCACGA